MSVKIYSRAQLDVEQWDELVQHSDTGTVQALSWYIDTLTDGKWLACVYADEKTGQWQGVMPLFETRKMGNIFSRQPILSKYWGTIIREPEETGVYQQLHFYKKVSTDLLKAGVSRTAVFDYFTGLMPSYPGSYLFEGLKASLRLTYVLNLNEGLDALRMGYSKTVRKRIRKLSERGFRNEFVDSMNDLEKVLMANKSDGTMPIPVNAIPPLKRLIGQAQEHQKGFLISTFSPSGALAAAGFFVFDERTTHFISGYVHPDYRKENAMTLLVDGAIQEAVNHSSKFDFFGSSIESIESFFRSFGPSPVAYYRVIRAKFPFSLVWNG